MQKCIIESVSHSLHGLQDYVNTSYSDYIIQTIFAVAVASGAICSPISQPAAAAESYDGETSASEDAAPSTTSAIVTATAGPPISG